MHPLNLLPLALLTTASPLLPRATTLTATDLTNFRFYSQYSGAAYCNSNTTLLTSPISCTANVCPLVSANRATLSATINDKTPTNIDGFLALDPTANLLVLSVRGSASIRNWIANVLFATIPCPAGMFVLPDGTNCGIHTGFALAWASISNEIMGTIRTLLAAQPGRRLVLTGHSLGGAVANVAAAYLRGVEKIPCDVYSYGSPRVGNEGFAKAYNALSSSYTGSMGKDFRVTHAGDPVPRLPPLISGFRHTGVEYWIKTEMGGRAPSLGDFKICEGTANTGCNAGSLELSTDAHGDYFGDISGCGPGGSIKWKREGELDEGTRRQLEMMAELDREYVGRLQANGEA